VALSSTTPGRKKHPASSSPFYSRAYGGYTADQERFYRAHIQPEKKLSILDPMGGQGFLLADLAFQGAEVWLGDLNPAMSLLASLRAPEMIANCERLADWTENILNLLTLQTTARTLEYVDDWIPANIKTELQQYRTLFDIPADPFKNNLTFWRLPLRKRFAAALPILAARDIACFRSSDNQTWIKPGGLQRQSSIVEPIRAALATWRQFARERNARPKSTEMGKLVTRRMNAELGYFADCSKVNTVITSPPYANRLDYTRMWGPESQVAAALWNQSVSTIQTQQIGSNVVRGLLNRTDRERDLPRQVIQALKAIKGDGDYASSGYYYPFFLNYAVSMMNTMRTIASRVSKNGIIIVFVRDTVRKDILFPTGLLVEKALHDVGFRIVDRQRKIVKHHVGLRRRGSASGFYGIGQLEWWLAFRRMQL
jgi:hypothetical protein